MLLTLVVIVGIVLFVAGVAQLLLSGQVFRQAARGAGGMACECFADSVVEDVLFQLHQGLNDRASPIFRPVREALLLRREEWLDLGPWVSGKDLERLMKDSPNQGFYRNFEIADLSAGLRLRPREGEGESQLVTVQAGVRLTIGNRSVYRSVRVDRQIGITRVAPVRPFDQVPFAIQRTTVIADLHSLTDLIEMVIKSYNQSAEHLVAYRSQIEGRPLGAPMTVTIPPLQLGTESIGSISAELNANEQYFFPNPWEKIEERSPGKRLPRDDDAVIFARPDEEVDLAQFDYYARIASIVKPVEQSLEGVIKEFASAMTDLEQRVAGGPLPGIFHARWADRMGRVGQNLKKNLEKLQDEIETIADHVGQHSQAGMTDTGALFVKHYESILPIYPLAQHVTGISSLDKLRKAWESVSGHLAIYPEIEIADPGKSSDSSSDRLVLENFQGQAILGFAYSGGPGVLEGYLPIGAIQMADPALDRVVVHADLLKIEGGPIQAALVVRKNLVTKSPADIHGSLILLEYTKSAFEERGTPWKGRVRYDERFDSGTFSAPDDLSGIKLDRYVVSLNPRLSYKEVGWSP